MNKATHHIFLLSNVHIDELLADNISANPYILSLQTVTSQSHAQQDYRDAVYTHTNIAHRIASVHMRT